MSKETQPFKIEKQFQEKGKTEEIKRIEKKLKNELINFILKGPLSEIYNCYENILYEADEYEDLAGHEIEINFNMPEIKSALQKRFKQELKDWVEFEDFSTFVIEYIGVKLDPEFLEATLQKGLVQWLSEGRNSKEILDFARKENIELDFHASEIKTALQKGLKLCLSESYTNKAEEIIDFAKEHKIEIDTKTPEVRSALQKGLEFFLSEGKIEDIPVTFDFAKKYQIEINLMNPQIESSLKKGFETLFPKKKAPDFKFTERQDFKLKMDIPEEKTAFRELLEHRLNFIFSQGNLNFDTILKIATKNDIEIDLHTPEIKSALERGLHLWIWTLSGSDRDRLGQRIHKILEFTKEHNIEFDIDEKTLDFILKNVKVDSEYVLGIIERKYKKLQHLS